MTNTQRKPRIGRKRWGDVVRYLTETMKTSSNERLRMQAAMRLADILTLREQREQLEIRRQLRLEAKATDDDQQAPDVLETAEQFIARVNGNRMIGNPQE